MEFEKLPGLIHKPLKLNQSEVAKDFQTAVKRKLQILAISKTCLAFEAHKQKLETSWCVSQRMTFLWYYS